MRLATLDVDGTTVPAVAVGGRWHRLDGHASLIDVLRSEREADYEPAAELPVGAPLRAPLVPGKIVAVGLNYMDHVRETGMNAPDRPLLFAKFPSSVIGPQEAIIADPSLTERPDWEVELAVVIGQRARDVPEEQALEVVAGYTIGNDVSARDVQFADGQWVRGKSLDTFCPLGPWITTADEIPEPQDLALRTRVNGETVQDSTTAEMVFGVRELIAFCSRSFTLDPGDVILTGTPWGVGEFRDPRRWLRPGDVVECEIERIGVLRNPVAASRAPSAAGSR